ncbi:MAG: glutamate racemase [Actinomycetota bacterium]|nr:glutamate racemase [Actinomycetota bacterium]MDI6821926.1 glutamate racemase [Actinomycetota bacterium]
MDSRPLGVFDSGVGGLTVVSEIIKGLPNESIIYFGDTARFPYGSKNSDDLQRFTFEIIDFLREEGIKLVVIACNSASSAALEAAQKRFDIPIVGVIEPGARAAVLATRTRKVGVIGTQATISSGAYARAVRLFDAGVQVYSQACPELADFVERGEISGPNVERVVRWYLSPLISAGVDSLILGCTHYPLLTGAIQKVVGDEVRLISSAKEAARELKELLAMKGSFREGESIPFYRFISSGDQTRFLELGERFLGREINAVERVSLKEIILPGGGG